MTLNPHCKPEILQKLLKETLPEREETEIANHLSTCSVCRREFESLAADNTWWAEARTRLSGCDTRRGGELSTGCSSLGDLSHDDEIFHFSTDFAVDFLEPSDRDDGLGRLGEYEISEVIGRGGMGIVLKGFQKELHRHVAVNVLSPHLATSGAARRRFAREAQATAAVVHPHVMAIHSVNATAKLPYLVMPLVDCQSLQERLDQQGFLDVRDVLRIGMQAASGLAAAHAQGLVHRDVKPANILLETNVDRVLLTDFGLARAVDDATLTRTGIIAGTPQYMSPEQANGDAVDRRSDLFSLGGVLYAMCTGRSPFRAETTFGILRRIRETSPRPIREINPEIPQWLERIVMKLLAKEAADRFDTARDVAALLEQCLAHVQQPISVPLPTGVGDWILSPESVHKSSPLVRWVRRHPWMTGLLASGLIASTLMFSSGWFSTARVPTATRASMAKGTGTSPALLNQEAKNSASSGPQESIPGWTDTDAELDEAASLLDIMETSIQRDIDSLNQKEP